MMMKKLLLLLPIFVFSFSVNATDKVDIRLNLEPNHSYSMNTNMNSSVRVNMEGFNMEVKTDHNVDIEYIVKSKSKEGYLFEGFYRKFERETIVVNQRTAQTTDINKLGEDGWTYDELFASLINKPFYIETTDKGESLSIDGFDVIMEGFREVIITHYNKMLSDEQVDSFLEVINSGYGKKMINSSFSFFNTIIPPKPVSVGDKWSVKLNHNAWGVPVAEGVCEYKGIYDGSYRIDGEYDLKLESREFRDYFDKTFAAFIPESNIEIKFNDGDIDITILLNSTTGWIEKVTTKSKIKCVMSLDNEGERLEFPLELDIYVVVEG